MSDIRGGTMTRNEALEYFKNKTVVLNEEEALANTMAIKTLEQEPCEEYKRGWHDAIVTALKETHNYYTEDGVFKAIQEESLIGVGMSMQEPKTEWIPVSERLPKKNVEVLVTTEWGCITIGEMFSNNDWFIHEGATSTNIDDIKAWMPLPKPYSEVSE